MNCRSDGQGSWSKHAKLGNSFYDFDGCPIQACNSPRRLLLASEYLTCDHRCASYYRQHSVIPNLTQRKTHLLVTTRAPSPQSFPIAPGLSRPPRMTATLPPPNCLDKCSRTPVNPIRGPARQLYTRQIDCRNMMDATPSHTRPVCNLTPLLSNLGPPRTPNMTTCECFLRSPHKPLAANFRRKRLYKTYY